MDSPGWGRIQSLFIAALDLEPGLRSAYLDEACAGEGELRREVEAMLSVHGDDRALAIEGRLLVDERPDLDALVGAEIGKYRVIRPIGRGGMGEVYLAERHDAQYRQEVALKLVGRGFQPVDVVRRFKAERQILARLVHPNIARLLDGGVTDDDRPYLVMEYVPGVPITQFCNERRLSIGDRLRLFRTVCAAVQYAHRNLVVHRDVKPSNVLVTEQGDVKLLDFGIAKLLDPDAEDVSVLLTQTAVRVMTPEYAAPEQVRGETITTATDVYALGVLLYELLTGHRPHRLSRDKPAEFERVICSQEPSWPSIIVGTQAESPGDGGPVETLTPERVSADRATQTARLKRMLRGDLDNIVMMALRKEPERRYASAEQFAEDIDRYVNGRPVIAQKDTLGYRVGKFVRRNRTGVAVAAVMFLLVLGFGVVMAVQASRISRQAEEIAQERDRAQLEAEKAVQVADFLEDLFKSADPFAATPERLDTLRVGDFLAQGADRVKDELEEQPIVQAQLLDVLGGVYRNLGRYGEARPLMEQALKIRREESEAELDDVAESMNDLALLLVDLGDHEEADSLFREALRLGESSDNRFAVFTVLRGLGNLMQDEGEFDEAERFYREAVQLGQELFPEDHRQTAGIMMNLATVLTRKADFDAAEPLMRQALEIQRETLGRDHPVVGQGLNNLAFLLGDKGELDEAEQMHREALAISRNRFDSPHPRIATSLNNLAAVLQEKRDFDAAEPYFRESLAMRRQIYGNEHPAVAIGLSNLASVIGATGENLEDAERMYRESIGILGKLVGPEHPVYGTATDNLANNLHLQGDHEAAEVQFRISLAIRRSKLPAGHPATARSLMGLGRCLADVERYEEAEPLLLESFDTFKEVRHEQARAWNLVLERLAALYTAWGRPEQAAQYEASLFEPA